MAKTKRYRAIKSPNKKMDICSDETTSNFENSGRIKHLSEATRPALAESKTGLPAARDLSYIGREIFWIIVTAGIVIILLLIAYFIFR